jgi:hypothetical protein
VPFNRKRFGGDAKPARAKRAPSKSSPGKGK